MQHIKVDSVLSVSLNNFTNRKLQLFTLCQLQGQVLRYLIRISVQSSRNILKERAASNSDSKYRESSSQNFNMSKSEGAKFCFLLSEVNLHRLPAKGSAHFRNHPFTVVKKKASKGK